MGFLVVLTQALQFLALRSWWAEEMTQVVKYLFYIPKATCVVACTCNPHHEIWRHAEICALSWGLPHQCACSCTNAHAHIHKNQDCKNLRQQVQEERILARGSPQPWKLSLPKLSLVSPGNARWHPMEASVESCVLPLSWGRVASLCFGNCGLI